MRLVRKLKNTVQMARSGRKAGGAGLAAPEPGRTRITLRLPSPWDERPWLTLQLGYQRRPAARGEYTRLTTHLETRIPRLQRESGEPTQPATQCLGAPDRGTARLPGGFLPRLASQRLETDFDLLTSTLPLNGGALELAGQAMRKFGVSLQETGGDAPGIRHWHQRYARPDGGRSRLSVVYGSHLPAGLGAGRARFNFAATVFSTLYPEPGTN